MLSRSLRPPSILPPPLADIWTSSPGLARDDMLPHRDQMLDPTLVRARIGALGLFGGPVGSIKLIRVKYRVGESLRSLWRVAPPPAAAARGAAVNHLVTFRAFARPGTETSGPGTSCPRSQPGPDEIDDAVVTDPGWGALWWRFPADRRIRFIGSLLDPDRDLARRLDLTTWSRSEIAEYAPERSLTVRAVDSAGAPVAYLKGYAPGSVDVARLAARYELVASWFDTATGMASPRVLGSGGDVLALGPLSGRTLAATADVDPAVLAQLGAAIAHLHNLPVATTTGLTGPFGRLEAKRLQSSADIVALARPDVGDAVLNLARRLTRRPSSCGLVLLHGDCHPRNLIVGPRSVGLIDLDQAGLGEPSCDIASLLARLLHNSVSGLHSPERAIELSSAFLDGYRRHRDLPDPANLRWHLAAAVVAERAIRAVNRINPAGLLTLPRTLELGAGILDGNVLTDTQLGAGR